jgi:hypothetical protein
VTEPRIIVADSTAAGALGSKIGARRRSAVKCRERPLKRSLKEELSNPSRQDFD